MTHSFTCPMEDCHFMVQSDDDGEVIHVVREHATDRHGMQMSDKDVRKGMAAA